MSQMIDPELKEQVKLILLKSGPNRSYDDIVTLKMYLGKVEFMKNRLPGLHPKQVDDLCLGLTQETYFYNDYVFHQGDIGDKLYLVFSGKCDIKVKFEADLGHGIKESREKTVFSISDGAHFGERALESDEPRAASIICTSPQVELISVTKECYVAIMNQLFSEIVVPRGTKQSVINILSKAREKRQKNEIEEVVAYFKKKVAFFQKFTTDQQTELARVAEIVSIWGQQVLFKQGVIGSCFYIILTGNVEVFVNTPEEMLLMKNNESKSRSGSKTDGLGHKVSVISAGGSFGERALESDASVRMASIVTSDLLTELIVITKEDYLNLIYVMNSADSMAKITLLRKTLLFRDVDVSHLKELAKFMEPRSYRLDDVVYNVGERAMDMYIIHHGECRVEVSIEQTSTKATNTLTNESNSNPEVMNIGRIGPASILCDFITQCDSVHDSMYQTETVKANTPVVAYSIGKNDFFNSIAAISRETIVSLVKHHKPPLLPHLWDLKPKIVGETEWKKGVTWVKFREKMTSNARNQDIIESLHSLRFIHLSENSGNDRPHKHSLSVANYNPSNSQSEDINTSNYVSNQTKSAAPESIDPYFPEDDYINTCLTAASTNTKEKLNNTNTSSAATETELQVSKSLRILPSYKKKAMDLLYNNEPLSNLTGQPIDKSDDKLPGINKYPFALIQYHREPLRLAANNAIGTRRLVRCHFRLCGNYTTNLSVKDAVTKLIRNIYIKVYKNDIFLQNELSINWNRFIGYDSMPLQSTDHFIIFCRNAPLEYASFTLSKDLLLHDFPYACRPKCQIYTTVSVRNLVDARNNPFDFDNSEVMSMPDTADMKQEFLKKKVAVPLFLSEFSMLNEVLATSSTYVESLRYGLSTISKTSELANSMLTDFNPTVSVDNESNTITITGINRLRICVVPLYEWLVISDATFKSFDISNKSYEAVERQLKESGNTNTNTMYEKEMLKALQESKLLTNVHTHANSKEYIMSNLIGLSGNIIGKEDVKHISPLVTLKALDREIARRQLSKDFIKSAKFSKNNNSSPSLIPTEPMKSNTLGSTKDTGIMVDSLSDQYGSSKKGSGDVGSNKKEKPLINNTTTEDTLKALSNSINIRKNMLELNDTLCAHETGGGSKRASVLNKVDMNNDGYISNDEDEEIKWSRRRKNNENTEGKESAGMGLLTQRMILFDTLNSVPLQATYDNQLKSIGPNKISNKLLINSSIVSDYSSGNQSENGKLKTKLAVLDDMLQRGKELYRGAGKVHNFSMKYDTDDEY